MKVVVVVLGIAALVACGKKDTGEGELATIADEMCGCTNEACLKAASGHYLEWTQHFPDGATKGSAAASVQKIALCSDRTSARLAEMKAPPPVDAAVVAIAVDAAEAPPPPLAPPDAAIVAADAPIEGRPPGISDASIAKLDAAIARLRAMDRELRAAGDDCALDATIVVRTWKGFVPIKKLMREANPKRSPAIDAWFEQGYLRRGLGALDAFMTNSCESPEMVKANDAQDFLGMKTVR